ncbi:MAG: SpoIIE family protein phosphatase [Magnetococcales bacterium]|nr:SpoIIE family protein phosphatase [Magnetococcales bacterium]
MPQTLTIPTPHDQHRPIVLIVDDTPENIDVLRGALDAHYVVRIAPNGEIALKAAHVAPHPDLVLLDIMMPGMDGYEVCRRLKSDSATQDIPIIFVTAKAEESDELKGLALGAVDYIAKPIRTSIVQARVKTHLALRFANRALDRYNQRLLQERELIEKSVLKMRSADLFDDRHLDYLVSPVERTAGDMLLSTFTPEGRQLVLLGDFTGHGLPAAIGGPLVAFILQKLAQEEASGGAIFSMINDKLCDRLPTGIFFAAALVEIDAARQRATIWNAGLPDVLLLRSQNEGQHLSSQWPPLGILKSLDLHAGRQEPLLPGDGLFVFSDGVIEARDDNNTMYGIERMIHFLQGVLEGRHAMHALMAHLKDHVGSQEHEDDITVVGIHQ